VVRAASGRLDAAAVGAAARRASRHRDVDVYRDRDRRRGATATGTFSLTVTGPPPPTPPGCQTGGTLTETLFGPAFNGQTPDGLATADETQFSGCGGFSILSVQVNNVNLPDGTQLWVTLDFGAVGTITLTGGAGTMADYNMGRFGVSRDQVRVYSALPDVSTFQQILIGGFFS